MFFTQESNPWWRVTLEKPLYVESIEITDKIDCCPRDIGMIKLTVSTNHTGDPSCTKTLKYGKSQQYKEHCSPPALGRYVTVTLTGDSVTLVLCYVLVRTFGKSHCMYFQRVAWCNMLQDEVLINYVLTSMLTDLPEVSMLRDLQNQNGLCNSSGSSPSHGTLCCVLGQDTTLMDPLSTQLYKWVPPNSMLEVTLQWTSIQSMGCGSLP